MLAGLGGGHFHRHRKMGHFGTLAEFEGRHADKSSRGYRYERCANNERAADERRERDTGSRPTDGRRWNECDTLPHPRTQPQAWPNKCVKMPTGGNKLVSFKLMGNAECMHIYSVYHNVTLTCAPASNCHCNMATASTVLLMQTTPENACTTHPVNKNMPNIVG